MTRKTFEKKMKALILAIYKHPGSKNLEGFKVGEALKRYTAKTIDLSRCGGSYKAAWNSDPLKFARQYYLGEDV